MIFIHFLQKFLFNISNVYNSSWHKLQSSFFAHFMCFEVPTLVPPGGVVNGNKAGYDDDDDLGIMDIDENDSKSGTHT